MTEQTIRDIFVVGLRNAHALENEALSIMNRQLDRLESYPELAQRLRLHVDETEGQIDRLDAILEGLSEDASTLKDTAASVMGNMAALGHTVAGDEILKNTFADYAFENYEIAAYRSLLAMAEQGAFMEAMPLLQQSLEQEEDMARWLEGQLKPFTLRYVERETAGLQAKR